MEIYNQKPTEPAGDEWVKVPGACPILQCGPARLYEILANLETEDPQGIIKTFVNRSPGSTRGTRLLEVNSLRRFMAFRYEQAAAESAKKLERNRCPVIA